MIQEIPSENVLTPMESIKVDYDARFLSVSPYRDVVLSFGVGNHVFVRRLNFEEIWSINLREQKLMSVIWHPSGEYVLFVLSCDSLSSQKPKNDKLQWYQIEDGKMLNTCDISSNYIHHRWIKLNFTNCNDDDELKSFFNQLCYSNLPKWLDSLYLNSSYQKIASKTPNILLVISRDVLMFYLFGVILVVQISVKQIYQEQKTPTGSEFVDAIYVENLNRLMLIIKTPEIDSIQENKFHFYSYSDFEMHCDLLDLIKLYPYLSCISICMEDVRNRLKNSFEEVNSSVAGFIKKFVTYQNEFPTTRDVVQEFYSIFYFGVIATDLKSFLSSLHRDASFSRAKNFLSTFNVFFKNLVEALLSTEVLLSCFSTIHHNFALSSHLKNRLDMKDLVQTTNNFISHFYDVLHKCKHNNLVENLAMFCDWIEGIVKLGINTQVGGASDEANLLKLAEYISKGSFRNCIHIFLFDQFAALLSNSDKLSKTEFGKFEDVYGQSTKFMKNLSLPRPINKENISCFYSIKTTDVFALKFVHNSSSVTKALIFGKSIQVINFDLSFNHSIEFCEDLEKEPSFTHFYFTSNNQMLLFPCCSTSEIAEIKILTMNNLQNVWKSFKLSISSIDVVDFAQEKFHLICYSSKLKKMFHFNIKDSFQTSC